MTISITRFGKGDEGEIKKVKLKKNYFVRQKMKQKENFIRIKNLLI